MQLMMFAIPALNPGGAVEEMNRFLRSHRVLSVDRQLVGGDTKAYWAERVRRQAISMVFFVKWFPLFS